MDFEEVFFRINENNLHVHQIRITRLKISNSLKEIQKRFINSINGISSKLNFPIELNFKIRAYIKRISESKSIVALKLEGFQKMLTIRRNMILN
jgi:hypothetical protein